MKRINYLYAGAVCICVVASSTYLGGMLGLWLSLIGIVILFLVLLLLISLADNQKPKIVYRVICMKDGSKFIIANTYDTWNNIKAIYKGKPCILSGDTIVRGQSYTFHVELPEIPYLSVEHSAKTDEIVSPSIKG